MAEKKPSGFRFRLPWLIQHSPTPAKEPRTTTQTSVASTPAQRPPFRPPGKAPAPVAAPPMVATSAPASPEQSPPQSVSPPPSVSTKSSAPKSPVAKSIEPVATQPAKETQTTTETTPTIETAAPTSPPQTPSFRPPTQAQSQPSPPQTPPAGKPNSQPSSPSHLSTPPQPNSKPLSPSRLAAQTHEATPPPASSKPPSPVHSSPAHTPPRSPTPSDSQPTDKPSTSPPTETTSEVSEIKRLIEKTKEKVQVDSNHVPQSGDLSLDAEPREITKMKVAETKSMDSHLMETKSQKPKPVTTARVPLHREIKDDISKFIHKIATSSSKQTMDEKPASVITIAGDNTGASMHLGVDAIKRGNKLTTDSTAHDAAVDGDRSSQRDSKASQNQKTKAIVNSNIQGINNTMMFNSSVTEWNPGVHLGFNRNLANNSNSKIKNTESMEMQRAEVNITPPQEIIYDLTTESLLGGLFMEPRNSEPDDPETSGKGYEIEVL